MSKMTGIELSSTWRESSVDRMYQNSGQLLWRLNRPGAKAMTTAACIAFEYMGKIICKTPNLWRVTF